MNQNEVGQMRLKQIGIMNGAILLVMLILNGVTALYPIKFSHFFLTLGIIVLFQGIYGLIKGNSTKSFFAHREKIANYEKEKMGDEWWKQRKVGHIWSLVFSFILFLQAYLHLNNDALFTFQFDLIFMLIVLFFMLLLLNFSMIRHFRKVDRSFSVHDFKGYTWKTNLLAVGVGIVVGILMIVITFSYIFSQF